MLLHAVCFGWKVRKIRNSLCLFAQLGLDLLQGHGVGPVAEDHFDGLDVAASRESDLLPPRFKLEKQK